MCLPWKDNQVCETVKLEHLRVCNLFNKKNMGDFVVVVVFKSHQFNSSWVFLFYVNTSSAVNCDFRMVLNNLRSYICKAKV